MEKLKVTMQGQKFEENRKTYEPIVQDLYDIADAFLTWNDGLNTLDEQIKQEMRNTPGSGSWSPVEWQAKFFENRFNGYFSKYIENYESMEQKIVS